MGLAPPRRTPQVVITPGGRRGWYEIPGVGHEVILVGLKRLDRAPFGMQFPRQRYSYRSIGPKRVA